MTTTTTPNPVPVEDHQFPGHPYRFHPDTGVIEVWQYHANEWRTAVALTDESIERMAAAVAARKAAASSGDPMDEGDKRDRIDGGGFIWSWSTSSEHWEHVSDELAPVATLAEINEAAGPLRIDGGTR